MFYFNIIYAASALAIATCISFHFKIIRDYADIELFLKISKIFNDANHRLWEKGRISEEISYEFEVNVIEYLNILECLARLYYETKLPKITKKMLKEELINHLTTMKEFKSIEKLIMESMKYDWQNFEYLRMIRRDYL